MLRVSLDKKGKAWGRHCSVLIESLLWAKHVLRLELGNVGNLRKASNFKKSWSGQVVFKIGILEILDLSLYGLYCNCQPQFWPGDRALRMSHVTR